VKTCNRYAVCGVIGGLMVLLSACASGTQQQQTLSQIQSQLSVLSNEVRDSFEKSEEGTIAQYKELNDEIRVLQKNQADAAAVDEQLSATLAAIEGKLDEYNTRMNQLSERLDSSETALTDRMTVLSDQVNDMGTGTRMTPPRPVQAPPVTAPELPTQSTEQTVQEPTLESAASQVYHGAYTAYVNGDFDTAIAGFSKYIETYPKTELADMAQFWVAESFFSLGEFETALQEYNKVIEQFPKSDKVPDAYLGKADAFRAVDRQIEAMDHLKYVVEHFPDSAAAQKAKQELQRFGQ